MANKLNLMDLKQIFSLHKDRVSNRQIAEILGISRNTVNAYIRLAKASGKSIEDYLSMDNHELDALFTSQTTLIDKRHEELAQWFDKINQERSSPGFTFKFHYEEYCLSVSKPYSYTQFMEHYHRKFDNVKGSMKLEHEAGKEVYIDYAGKKLHIVNRETGELIGVEVFVAILPSSNYTYVRACMSQKREDLISCMAHALSYFGGVPKAIVSDNLKSAVSRASKYEAEINRSFKDFAQHYGCVINPTRSYSPQDKALVENAVHLVYQRIYYPMRNMTFFTLEDLNKEIERLLISYNNLLLQRKELSRKELFITTEKSYLKPLPTTAYELKDYCRAKVQKIGYIYFSPDKNYYSVPYKYIGKSTLIHYTATVVEVYHNHQRIALHKRNFIKGRYTTNKDHLSSTHKSYTEWSPDYFIRKASNHGEHVLKLIEHIVTNCDYPETNYKRAMGIIQLHKIYGSDRLNAACERSIFVDTYSYNYIKNILINNHDKLPLPDLESADTHIPKHENLRGASEYK